MSKYAASPLAPNDHPYYIALRESADSRGLLTPFRRLCMLLSAPPDFGSGVFLPNLCEMLKRIPKDWNTRECFDGWGELLEWWSQSDKNAELPREFPRARDPRGGTQEVEWTNLSPVPIFWAAESETSDTRYLLVLAHMLLTRFKDLQESPLQDGKSYEDLYEAYAGHDDFASQVRSPWRAAAAICAVARRLSQERQQHFLNCIAPTVSPDKFGVCIPELLPSVLQDLEPLAERIKQYCCPKAVAPKDHPSYKTVCSALEGQGLKEPFRKMCMILNAPPDLRPLTVVLRTAEEIVSTLPAVWNFDLVFDGWHEVAMWILQEENLRKLELDARARLDTDPRTRTVEGVTYNEHPMDGEGISKFHLFSMMCDMRIEKPEEYRRLQAQLLVARWRELSNKKTIAECVANYEAYAGDEDFASFARSPDRACRAARRLSEAKWNNVIAYLQPKRIPDEFAEQIELSKIPLGLDGEDLSSKVWNIRNYCRLKTSAREDVQSGPRRRGFRGPRTFIPYNETRFGIEASVRDDDDPEFNEDTNAEWIFERHQDEETSAAEEVHANEHTSSSSFLLFGSSGKGSEPGNRAAARTHVHHIEIDKERMPWSATQLRPSEITSTVLAGLRTESLVAIPQTRAERSELELAALVAVCLETGRSIRDSMDLCFITDGIPRGGLCFIPGANPEEPAKWCIKTIEPDYKTIREAVGERELPRAPHLLYSVHPVPGRILSLLEQVTPHEGERRAFSGSEAVYKKQVRDWLLRRWESDDLPNAKRLTITKISGLKWRLLEQHCGCDFATASIVLGFHHKLGEVALHYSLISLERAKKLFQAATDLLWKNADGTSFKTVEEVS